jgi:hypothetical protein
VAQQVEAVREKVERYVEDLVGPFEVDQWDQLHFRWGSAHVFVQCLPYGDDGSVVFITIPLLARLSSDPELFRHVALHADDWHFGHLSLTQNKDDNRLKLWLTHSLLGDYLDVEELKTALAAMGKIADGLDDELKAKFGGDRYHED